MNTSSQKSNQNEQPLKFHIRDALNRMFWLLLVSLGVGSVYTCFMLIPPLTEGVLSGLVSWNVVGSGVICFLIVVCYGASQVRPVHATTYANLITVMGILGTFLGITLGLAGFQVANVQESIPLLLEGLKTAFVTSIVGMSVSTLVRWQRIIGVRHVATLETVADLIRGTNDRLEMLQQQIAGTADTSLANHLKRIEDQYVLGKQDVIKAFQEISKTQTRSTIENTRHLLVVLTEQLNKNLQDILGVDRLNQLVECIGQLIEAHARYQVTLETMTQRLEDLTKESGELAKSQKQIAKSSASLVEAATRLEPLLGTLDAMVQNLQSHLRILEELGRQVQDAIPALARFEEQLIQTINRVLEELLTQIGHSMHTFIASSTDMLENLIDDIVGQIDAKMEALKRELDNIADQVGISLEKANQKAQELLNKSAETLENFQALLEPWESEVRKVMTQCVKFLGENLIAISSKFTEDYRQIMSQWRLILELAQQEQERKQSENALSEDTSDQSHDKPGTAYPTVNDRSENRNAE